MSEAMRARCEGPAIPDTFATAADIGSFTVRQEAARQVCEARRAGLVDLIDTFNALGAR